MHGDSVIQKKRFVTENQPWFCPEAYSVSKSRRGGFGNIQQSILITW